MLPNLLIYTGNPHYKEQSMKTDLQSGDGLNIIYYNSFTCYTRGQNQYKFQQPSHYQVTKLYTNYLYSCFLNIIFFILIEFALCYYSVNNLFYKLFIVYYQYSSSSQCCTITSAWSGSTWFRSTNAFYLKSFFKERAMI